MSVNNAPGEVNKDKFFDSPNISSAEDEIEEPEVDKEAEERKKRETVEIDGVPIEGKEIKYKAEDIKKKGKMNYFVDVEGAENRAKNEAKKAEEEKAAAEKKAAEEKKSAERKVKEAEAAANREVVEEKKHLEEVNAYIKRQRKQKAHDDKKEKARDSRFRKLFWTGKRKLIIPAALIAIILSIFQSCKNNCIMSSKGNDSTSISLPTNAMLNNGQNELDSSVNTTKNTYDIKAKVYDSTVNNNQ